MRYRQMKKYLMLISILVLRFMDPLIAQTIYGVSGLIKTPDAYVVENGKCNISMGYFYDDMAESPEVVYSNVPTFSTIFIVGPISRIEVGLRVGAFLIGKDVEFKPQNFTIDLVTTIKGVIIKEKKYVPQISLGIQDIIGTWKFQSTYLVLSKTIKLGKQSNVVGTFGYGSKLVGYVSDAVGGKEVRDYRFIGFFGSFDGQITNFLSVMGEYDAKDWNFGLKLSYKDILYGKFFLTEYIYLGGQICVKFKL
jgi:hypothetical protein